MSHRHLFALLGCLLIGLGLVQRGWFLVAVWLGINFLVLGVAHARGWRGVFGKRGDGTIPLWSWIAFFPLLGGTWVVWHLLRLVIREPAFNEVTHQLVVGRRLLASECPGEFDNFVDLTAEFCEPGELRRTTAYVCFPILDGGAPSAEALCAAVAGLRPGRTFVHCAQGHGRSGLFALAMLLSSGAAANVDDALRKLVAARPGVRLSLAQRQCIENYAQQIG